jgi:hypothetical protein
MGDLGEYAADILEKVAGGKWLVASQNHLQLVADDTERLS